MDLGLKDKVALVAASSQGLGYGTARALAAEGARVSLCDINAEGVRAAAQRLNEETGADTLTSHCDVRDPAQIQAWVDKTVEKWGVVDALFINAGGLIMEVGGIMNHGSVVAREYGIPAIVGVRDATKTLKTGQHVRVDGHRGIIEIL